MQISSLRGVELGVIILQELLKVKNVSENAPRECELGKMRSKGKAWGWGVGGIPGRGGRVTKNMSADYQSSLI